MDPEAEDILRKLESVAERRIQEAIEAGEFDNLPGSGMPLNIEDNPFVPPDMRAAFTVLQNSGYAPDWMLLGQEIEAELSKLREDANRHFAHLRSRLSALASHPQAAQRLGREASRLRAEHKRAAARHRTHIEEINAKVRIFNNTVPIASLTRLPLDAAAEMAHFQDRLPAYLSYGQEA